MYINLNKKYLEDNKKQMAKDAISNIGNPEGKDNLLCEDIKDSIEGLEFKDGCLSVDIENGFGWFSFDVDIDDDIAFQIIEHMKKKGQEIKRLIDLTR